LFQDPWWLDLVTAGNWEEVSVASGGGVAARLPFLKRKKYGLTILAQPALTPYCGVCFGPLEGKAAKQFSEQRQLTAELVGMLPPFDLFLQNLWPELTNWLPLYWSGFSQTSGYTNWIRDLGDADALWANFLDSTRGQIRKAEKRVRVVASDDVERLCTVVARTYEQQNLRQLVPRETLFRAAEGSLRRGNGRITFAEDEAGNTHAVNFLVFDERSAHYIVGGSDNRFRTSGAASLLMWEAIKFAANKSALFDFEGSMVEPISRFFRGFNPTPMPICRIFKFGRRAQFLVGLRDAAAAVLGRPPLRF
jgi:hypothetical protein